jgi:ppGpp synthetase/RelA/SpoT-type nucleotidyltranferase
MYMIWVPMDQHDPTLVGQAGPPTGSPGPSLKLTELEIDEVVSQYLWQLARFEKAAQVVADRLRRELRAEARFRHLISYRAKHPDDLREKLRRKAVDQRYAFAALKRDLNAVVTDLAGCRVVVYAQEDESRVAAIIDRVFRKPRRDDAEPPPCRKEGGYRATHRLVLTPEGPEDLSIDGAICEVQVTTLAAHLFNELEHDILYKQNADAERTTSAVERELLEEVRFVTRVADRHVDLLVKAKREASRDVEEISTPEALRFTLEHLLGRPLAGDFTRLHRMLEATVQPLTTGALTDLGDAAQLVERGKATARRIGVSDDDDVVHFVLGTEELHPEFLPMAASWRGPRTPLKRALEKLSSVTPGQAAGAPVTGPEEAAHV